MSDCETLFLIPSETELKLANALHLRPNDQVQLCGIGVVASAARSMQLINQFKPIRVVLLGIAGAYRNCAVIGDVVEFGRVALYGVGAGNPTNTDSYLSLAEMGLKPIPSELPNIDDVINFAPKADAEQKTESLLLSVCASAGSDHQVDSRRRRFPDAVAEDMEGFSVAMACELQNVPLRIFRGISNLAGDRNQANWNIPEAMSNCIEHLNRQTAH